MMANGCLAVAGIWLQIAGMNLLKPAAVCDFKTCNSRWLALLALIFMSHLVAVSSLCRKSGSSLTRAEQVPSKYLADLKVMRR